MVATYSEILKRLEADGTEIREVTEFSMLIRALPREKRQIAEGFILGLAATENMTPTAAV